MMEALEMLLPTLAQWTGLEASSLSPYLSRVEKGPDVASGGWSSYAFLGKMSTNQLSCSAEGPKPTTVTV